MNTESAFRIMELALDRGAEEAEVFQTESVRLLAEVKNGSLETIVKAHSLGYCLRVVRDKRMGFSFSNNPEDAESVVERAISISRFSEQDDANRFPMAAPPVSVDIFDEALADLPEEEAIGQVLSMEQAAYAFDPRIARTRKASGSFGSRETLVLNSQGVNCRYRKSFCSAQIMAVAEEDGESQSAWDFAESSFSSEVSFGKIGENAARQAVRLLGARRAGTFRGRLLLDPSVTVDFIGLLASALSAEEIQKKKSMLAGKIGEQVTSPLLTLIDDGTIRGRTGTQPVDDEGTPAARKKLIDRGALTGYLHSYRTALKGNADPTGNARRSGATAIPSVGISNLFIEPDPKALPFDDMVRIADRGIYATELMGMHTANPVSGDFSVGASGVLIEGGRFSHPVREIVISGNILTLLGSLMIVGGEIVFYGGIGAPALLIEGVDFSG